jgi:hypothetical protein
MRQEQDKILVNYIEAAQKYYLLEALKTCHLKKRPRKTTENIDIFDKYRMFTEGKDYWEVAAHFGMSEGGCRENIKRARSKVIIYKKLLEKGLL